MIEHLQQAWSLVFNFDVHAFLEAYGYYAILVLTFLEGESIVILAGIAAYQGALDPVLVTLCAFAGSTISDQVMFSLGKYKGAAVLKHFPRLNKNIDKAGRLIKKYDIFLILGFRFVYGVRNVTPFLLGVWGERHLKFLALNIIGAATWAISFTAVGFFASRGFDKAKEHLGGQAIYIICGIIALVLVSWFIRAKFFSQKSTTIEAKSQKKEDTFESSSVEELQGGLQRTTSADQKDFLPKATPKDSSDTES